MCAFLDRPSPTAASRQVTNSIIIASNIVELCTFRFCSSMHHIIYYIYMAGASEALLEREPTYTLAAAGCLSAFIVVVLRIINKSSRG